MSGQLELWEEVGPVRARRRGSQTPSRAPARNCRECGRPIGRRWKDGLLCGRCRRRETSEFPPPDPARVCCGRCPEGACVAIPY